MKTSSYQPILLEGRQYGKTFPSDDLNFKEYKRYVCKHYRRGCKIYVSLLKSFSIVHFFVKLFNHR